MATADIMLTINPEPEISLNVTEAKLKPEQDKTVTPTYSEQTVLPDAGMTIGSVTVEPIPEPTERLSITENGAYDVARFGGVDVEVPQGVFPSGMLEVTENGTYDVSEYENASVNVPIEYDGRTYSISKEYVKIANSADNITLQSALNSITYDGLLPATSLGGIMFYSLLGAPTEENQLICFTAGYYNSGVRTILMRYIAGRESKSLNPPTNYTYCTLKAGTTYEVFLLRLKI